MSLNNKVPWRRKTLLVLSLKSYNMYHCCKGFSNCCGECCKGISKCLDSCCKCCTDCDWCKRPFAPCASLIFFVMLIPGLACIIVALVFFGDDCGKPVAPHLLVQGIILSLHFPVALYLVLKYSKNSDGANPEPTESVFQRTYKLICYDFVICFYIVILLFDLVWLIIGHVWLDESDCPHKVLEATAYLSLILMWAFLIFGSLCFCCTLVTAACESGDCGLEHCCRDLWCGLCFPFTTERQRQNQHNAAVQRRANVDRGAFGQSVRAVVRLFGLNWGNQGNVPQRQHQVPPNPYQGASAPYS